MKIMIGGQDYASALDTAHPLTINRKLNEPSLCRLWLTFPAGTQSSPSLNQAVEITGDDGTTYFTGYVAAAPLPEYAGVGIEGPRYRIAVEAVSEEFLLNQAGMPPVAHLAGLPVGPIITGLVTKTGSGALSTQALSLVAPVSSPSATPGTTFSTVAKPVADQARVALRALNGALSLLTLPAATHALNESDGTLLLDSLALKTSERIAANDVLVYGEHEPTTYVTECFLGDGATSQFYLSDRVFAPEADHRTLIRELFSEGLIDSRLWGNSGEHAYLALGAGGLAMQGGTGRDGDTQLAWLDPVEMGGTLLMEAAGVTLASGSTGVLAGFFTGDRMQSACTAGFQIRAAQGSGNVSIQPLVNGSAAGTAYPVDPSNQYSLRVRVHCPEFQRTTAIYRSVDDSGPVSFGGDLISAPAKLQYEIQEFVNGVAGMPVTLFEGQIDNLPVTCSVIPASSTNLHGSIRTFNLTNLGSGWVVSTPPNGNATARRLGSPTQSAECSVEDSGRVVFYPGFAPAAGEQIAVSYRTSGRAAGRAANIAAQQQLAVAGFPMVSAWTGSVTNPPPRSSQDCRNAANALEVAASSPTALWCGSYKCSSATLDGDPWPGDGLQIDAPSAGINALLIVRTVELSYGASLPDVIDYNIAFANDWAEDLAIKTSSAVPSDAPFPVPPAAAYLPNLNGLKVVAVSGQSVTINAGTAAPVGGGFEIRRRDNSFMPGADAELVMRSSQPTMTFSRSSFWDRYYFRAYDGSNPPNYSEFSAALIFNLPLAS